MSDDDRAVIDGLDLRGPATLTDFLLARIAEDEAVARRARTLVPWIHIANAAAAHDQREAGLMVLDWRPSRVLAECEAKRRVVERLRGDAPGGPNGQIGWDYLDPTLLDLAAVYADHPDYRDEWRP